MEPGGRSAEVRASTAWRLSARMHEETDSLPFEKIDAAPRFHIVSRSVLQRVQAALGTQGEDSAVTPSREWTDESNVDQTRLFAQTVHVSEASDAASWRQIGGILMKRRNSHGAAKAYKKSLAYRLSPSSIEASQALAEAPPHASSTGRWSLTGASGQEASGEQPIEYARRAFGTGAYLDGLLALRTANIGAMTGALIEEMHTALQRIKVSYAVTCALARGLGWPPERETSLANHSPWAAAEAERMLAKLYEVAPRYGSRPDEPSETLLARARLRSSPENPLASMAGELPTCPATDGRLALLQAEEARASGRPRKCIAAFRQAANCEPSLTAAWRGIAVAAIRRGRPRAGARAYAEALDRNLSHCWGDTYVHIWRSHPIPISTAVPVSRDTRVGRAPTRTVVNSGNYREPISNLTRDFAETGSVSSLAGAHALLNEIDISAHALELAADRLGWPEKALYSLKQCQSEISAEEGQLWLRWLNEALPALAGAPCEPVEAMLACAQNRLRTGSDAKRVAAALPRSAAGKWRAHVIEAEAALAAGANVNWGKQLLAKVARHAPHVTIAHRRLGQIAHKERRGLSAARHFERAMLSPSTPACMADRAEAMPCRMITLNDTSDVYCYRGQGFVVRRNKDTLGVTIAAGRPFVVRNTRGYRQWSRMAGTMRLQLLRSIGVARSYAWSLSNPTVQRQNRLLRIFRAVARRLPTWVQRALRPLDRRALRLMLGSRKRASARAMNSSLAIVVYLVTRAQLMVLRFWLRADPISVLSDLDHVDDVFRKIPLGLRRPPLQHHPRELDDTNVDS